LPCVPGSGVASPVTDDIADTLRYIVERLEAIGAPYMLVGSVAALAHGRSRSTQHFDMVVEASAAKLQAFVRSLPRERFYADEQAALDALRHESLFNVIDMKTGWKVDIVPRKNREFSVLELSRKKELSVFGMKLAVASLEDTIIAKLEWAKLSGGSSRQLEDVAELARIAGSTLDSGYVAEWVKRLGLEAEWAAASDMAR
jgi:hypothetical protein